MKLNESALEAARHVLLRDIYPKPESGLELLHTIGHMEEAIEAYLEHPESELSKIKQAKRKYKDADAAYMSFYENLFYDSDEDSCQKGETLSTAVYVLLNELLQSIGD